MNYSEGREVKWWQLLVSYGITTICAWSFGFLLYRGQSDSATGLIYKMNMWAPTLSILPVLIAWPRTWRRILKDIGVIGGTVNSILLYLAVATILYPLVVLTTPLILSALGLYRLDLRHFSGLDDFIRKAAAEDKTFATMPPLLGALYAYWLYFSVNLFSVIGEECAWRGFILNRLLPLGQVRAVFLSALLWGVWMQPIVILGHAYFPNQPILGGAIMLLTAIIIGIIFGWLRLASGSIWPSVCAHSSNVAAFHACAFLGPSQQPIERPGLMIVGTLLPLTILIVVLVCSKRLPVRGRFVLASR